MNVAALEALIEIASKAFAAIQLVRKDDPAAYEAVSQHSKDALDNARQAASEP